MKRTNISVVATILIVLSTAAAGQSIDERQAMAKALMKGDVAAVDSLLRAGFPDTARVYEGKTLLMIACESGQRDLALHLIDTYDAPVNDTMPFGGANVLMHAVRGGNLELVKALVAKGARYRPKGYLKLNETGAYFGSTLNAAAGSTKPQSLAILEFLVETFSPDIDELEIAVNSTASSGWSPLIWACSNCDTAKAAFLIEQGADIDLATGECEIPLVSAIGEGCTAVARMLVDAGADVNNRNGNPGCRTPLAAAAWAGDTAIARDLLDHGARIDEVQSGDSSTALGAAVLNGHPHMVLFLLARGASATGRMGPHTSLHYALGLKRPAIARMLIERLRETGDSLRIDSSHVIWALADSAGIAGLQDYNQRFLFQMNTGDRDSLIAACLDVLEDVGYRITNQTYQDCTLFELALDAGAVSLARKLVASGADIYQKPRDYRKDDLLQVAIDDGNEAAIRFLVEQGFVVEKGHLLQAAARLNDGEPLSCETTAALVKQCFEYQPRMRRLGNHALNAAAAAGCQTLVSRLLEHDPEPAIVTATKRYYETTYDTVHIWKTAVTSGSVPAAKLILARASPITIDHDAEALEPIVAGGDPAMIEAVFEHVEPLSDTLVSVCFAMALRRSVPITGYLLDTYKKRLLAEVTEDAFATAVRGRDSAMIALLMKHGFGESKDEVARSFQAALLENDTAMAAVFLDNGADVGMWAITDDYSRDSLSLFTLCARRNNHAALRFLLAHGLDCSPAMATRALENAVRHSGSYYSSLDSTVALLLSLGAAPDVKDSEGHACLSKMSPSVIKMLIEAGADIEARDGEGNTVLMNKIDDTKLVAWLIERKADVNAQNHRGSTPLIGIVYKSDTSTLSLLLEAGADPYLADSAGDIALTRALRDDRNPANVRILLRRMTDFSWRDSSGNNLLHLIAGYRYVDSIAAAAVSRCRSIVREPNRARITPLMTSFAAGPVLFRPLMEAGADIHAIDTSGKSVLHHAAHAGCSHAVEALIRAGADVNARAHDGSTPIMYAAMSSYESLLRLKSAGASTGVVSSQGVTPLMCAASTLNAEAIIALRRWGADAAAVTKNGETAKDMLGYGDAQDTCRTLLRTPSKQLPPAPAVDRKPLLGQWKLEKKIEICTADDGTQERDTVAIGEYEKNKTVQFGAESYRFENHGRNSYDEAYSRVGDEIRKARGRQTEFRFNRTADRLYLYDDSYSSECRGDYAKLEVYRAVGEGEK